MPSTDAIPGLGSRWNAVLFDLDDTLYPEHEFVDGGFRAAAAVMARVSDRPVELLVEATLRLCAAIGLVGQVTVQAFRVADRILFIEVNPRYGGAANLGFAAGAPTPEFAIRMARGERLTPQLGSYEVGLMMLRYAEDRFVREPSLVGGAGS